MLVRLLYASRAAGPVTPEVIDGILAQCRAHNPALGITGILCHGGDVVGECQNIIWVHWARQAALHTWPLHHRQSDIIAQGKTQEMPSCRQFARCGTIGEAITPPVGQKGTHVSGGNFCQRRAVDGTAPVQLQKSSEPICCGLISADAMRRHPAIVGQEGQIFSEQRHYAVMLSGGSISLNRNYLRKDRIEQRHALWRYSNAVAIAGDEAKACDFVDRIEVQHFVRGDPGTR